MPSAQPEQRRLAAIVAADIAGYSRLMGCDESGTLQALRTVRRELVDPAIESHGGRLVLRVGINLGDIISEEGDIFGDGVMSLSACRPSRRRAAFACRAAHDEGRDRLDVPFEDGGAQSLKNVARPVHVWRWSPERGIAAGGRQAFGGGARARGQAVRASRSLDQLREVYQGAGQTVDLGCARLRPGPSTPQQSASGTSSKPFRQPSAPPTSETPATLQSDTERL